MASSGLIILLIVAMVIIAFILGFGLYNIVWLLVLLILIIVATYFILAVSKRI